LTYSLYTGIFVVSTFDQNILILVSTTMSIFHSLVFYSSCLCRSYAHF